MRVGGKNPKNVWWNDVVKSAVERKEVLGLRDEVAKDRCIEIYKEEKRKVKRCINQIRKEVNEQFGRKMHKDIYGNRKLFWKEVEWEKGGELQQNKQGYSER